MADRIELKHLFSAGKKPTEEHFAKLIDTMINQEEDRISVGKDFDKQSVGGISIGTTYAPEHQPPRDGLIVEGWVGIGVPTPEVQLDVLGKVSISEGLSVGGRPVINAEGQWLGEGLWSGTGNGVHTLANVGIGTDTPEVELDVNGRIKASGVMDAKSLTIGGQEVINNAGEWTGPSTQLWQISGNGLHTPNNVGIGIENPEKPLEVQGDIKLTGSLIVGETEVVNPSGELVGASTTGGNVPIGTILAFVGEEAPDGWFVCDGKKKSKNQYSELYNLLGTSWGPETTTTFSIPDLRGMFLRGWNNGRPPQKKGDPDIDSRTTGDVIGSYQDDQYQRHAHNVYPHAGYVGGSTNGAGGGDTATRVHGSMTSSEGGGETRPKNVYVNFIIKY